MQRSTKVLISLSALLLAVSMVCLAMWLSLIYEPPTPADRPKVTDWMQAWGSLGGFLAAVGAAGFTGWLLRHELGSARRSEERARLDRRTEAERSRRALAELVTYHLENGGDSGGARTPADWADESDHWRAVVGTVPPVVLGTLVVINNGTNCIYKMIASVPGVAEPLNLRGIGVIPPGVARVAFAMDHIMDRGSTAGRDAADFANNKLVPWIQFEDNAGVSWKRGNDGSLTEVANPVPFPNYAN
jgi:hypothetical protein